MQEQGYAENYLESFSENHYCVYTWLRIGCQPVRIPNYTYRTANCYKKIKGVEYQQVTYRRKGDNDYRPAPPTDFIPVHAGDPVTTYDDWSGF